MRKIALFASGGGSNAEVIITHFEHSDLVDISVIITDNPKAYVLERARQHGIAAEVITRSILRDEKALLPLLDKYEIDFIVLAGFLKLIPAFLIETFPKAIVNIHPALLPAYGGKGMYGKHVHQAVYDNNEKESGMTIHYVNEEYDEGHIIFQAKVALLPTDTPESIAQKVLALEHTHYAEVIEGLILA